MAKISKKPELLAPAGNLNKLKTALTFGADAVYFGLPDFSLRVRINDFDWTSLKQGISLAHKAGKKAYVTVNILAHNYHLKKLETHIKKLQALKPDALFVSDPGVMAVIRRIWPEAKISLSTQANCTNIESAKFWAKQGIKRIILSRELSIKEIAEVAAALPKTEIEVFVHGALCTAYSGRCFISDYLSERGANLGDCTQPCRWEYEIKPKGHDKSLVLGEDAHGSYILNSEDLCLIERLPEIIEAGVSALKIEGRAKSAYYLANVIGAYRRAIDLICESGKSKATIKKDLSFLRNELEQKLAHRGYGEGFMFRGEKNLQNTSGKNFLPAWEFCGQVLSSKQAGRGFYESRVKVHNTLLLGDELEIVSPPYQIVKIKLLELKNIEGEDITEAHGGGCKTQEVIVKTTERLAEQSVMRRRLAD